jgi:dihydrofolate synthase/folylpolyglutamate synthase
MKLTVQDIFALEQRGIERGLSRVEKLLEALGHPERAYPSVHVTGTNGKGSTCAMIAQILREGGYRVGLYTSPHLERWTERIQIDGVEASEEALLKIAEKIWPVVEKEGATFYEVTTALALAEFARQSVEIAVVEVGLGGRWDATNVVHPIVTVITHVALDHTEYLGESRLEIAAEKAGILKKGIPLVTAESDPEILSLFQQKAEELGVPVRVHGVDFNTQGTSPQDFRFRGGRWSLKDLSMNLRGGHQLKNASVALAVCEILDEKGFPLSESAVRDGLSHTAWPGRFEIFEGTPPIVIDAAHNPDGIEALLQALEPEFPRKPIVFVFGVSNDKPAAQMLSLLRGRSSKIILTQAKNPRATDPTVLKTYYSRGVVEENVEAALKKAFEICSSEGVICVCGSIFLIGEIRRMFQGVAHD